VNSVGEAGPGDKAPEELFRELGSVRLIELERGATDVARDELAEGGRVGARGGGCCRIRRRPDAPRPCSCSVITGDLTDIIVSDFLLSGTKEKMKHREAPVQL
jgi:hypothetical protein